MIRFIVRTGIMLVANAFGLIVASVALHGVSINVLGFIVAVVIFTVCLALLTPFFATQLQRRNSSALGGVALIATLVSLIITDLVSNGVSIDGLSGWLGGTVVVWGAGLIAAFVLPFFGLKKYIETRDTRR